MDFGFGDIQQIQAMRKQQQVMEDMAWTQRMQWHNQNAMLRAQQAQIAQENQAKIEMEVHRRVNLKIIEEVYGPGPDGRIKCQKAYCKFLKDNELSHSDELYRDFLSTKLREHDEKVLAEKKRMEEARKKMEYAKLTKEFHKVCEAEGINETAANFKIWKECDWIRIDEKGDIVKTSPWTEFFSPLLKWFLNWLR